jgi:hypothetical protein
MSARLEYNETNKGTAQDLMAVVLGSPQILETFSLFHF